MDAANHLSMPISPIHGDSPVTSLGTDRGIRLDRARRRPDNRAHGFRLLMGRCASDGFLDVLDVDMCPRRVDMQASRLVQHPALKGAEKAAGIAEFRIEAWGVDVVGNAR